MLLTGRLELEVVDESCAGACDVDLRAAAADAERENVEKRRIACDGRGWDLDRNRGIILGYNEDEWTRGPGQELGMSWTSPSLARQRQARKSPALDRPGAASLDIMGVNSAFGSSISIFGQHFPLWVQAKVVA